MDKRRNRCANERGRRRRQPDKGWHGRRDLNPHGTREKQALLVLKATPFAGTRKITLGSNADSDVDHCPSLEAIDSQFGLCAFCDRGTRAVSPGLSGVRQDFASGRPINVHSSSCRPHRRARMAVLAMQTRDRATGCPACEEQTLVVCCNPSMVEL